MTQLALVAETADVLRTRAEDFEEDQLEESREFFSQLLDLCVRTGAVGLAAPQVGLSRRVMVVNVGTRDRPDHQVMINPVLTRASESQACEREGCLSFPGLVLPVRRSAWCMVRWTDTTGKVIEGTLTELASRCFLHELDHLDGITFDRRVSRHRLEIAEAKRSRKRR